MQTRIHPDLAPLPEVQEADSILRNCVHCGFCTATCPTYQIVGDELDGPRGRIYLIKNLLEENTISSASAAHLDRCLTCRSCETTCPSGVAYGRLLDIGREFASRHVNPPPVRRMLSAILRYVIPRRRLFRPLLSIGQRVRAILPRVLSRHIPRRQRVEHEVVSTKNARVLMLTGCVQSAATPNVVASLAHLLEQVGIETEQFDEGCCGALDYHLAATEAGKARMRDVIDRLHPRLGKLDAIVSTATGCGVTLKQYPEILKSDPEYAGRAAEVAARITDAVTLLEDVALPPVPGTLKPRVAVHTPCSMQHGMQLVGRIESVMTRLGYEVVPHADGHLCCGSAGTYSMLQPTLSVQLRDRKLQALNKNSPELIVTANVGCQLHLDDASRVPVRHWLEVVAENGPGESGGAVASGTASRAANQAANRVESAD